MKSRYQLVVGAGSYEANSIFAFLWEVFRHRLWHWRRGDGWVD